MFWDKVFPEHTPSGDRLIEPRLIEPRLTEPRLIEPWHDWTYKIEPRYDWT